MGGQTIYGFPVGGREEGAIEVISATPVLNTHRVRVYGRHEPEGMTSRPPQDRLAALDEEIELVTSSLLPSETLTSSPRDQWPRFVVIASNECHVALHLRVDEHYPKQGSVLVEVKGEDDGREEAEGWKQWVAERMTEWDGEAE
jgi:hypothetical protein